MKIKKGDTVLVTRGKDKGKKGKVLSVNREKQRVVVEGVNIQKKHTRPTQRTPQGGVITQEGSIAVSNVMLVCPSCGEPTRVGYLAKDKDLKVRVCKKCDSEIL